METNAQIFERLDDLTSKVKFKGIRAMVVIAQDVIDKVNKNEKSLPEDFELLSGFTKNLDTLLLNFFKLDEILATPVFNVHEREITETLKKKTDSELQVFRESYTKTALKVDDLLKHINSRN